MKFHKIRTLVCGCCCVLLLRVVYVSLTAQDSANIFPDRPKNQSIFRPIIKNKSVISSLVSKPPGNSNNVSIRKDVIVENGTSMKAARAIYRRHGVVLFTMVNDAYFPFTASWCCNTAPMTNVHHRALFLTTDRTTGQRLTKLWPDVTVVTLNSSRFSGSQEYSKAGYVRMMGERTRYILHLLEGGDRLLLFEVDCVWLSDPVPALLARHAEGDILATKVTGREVTAGGFLLLNPTTATVKLWRRLTDMMDSLYRRLENRENFAAVSEGDNDQQYFTSLVRGKFAGIKVVYRPSDLFPDGKWYQLPAGERSLKPRSVLTNNNWVVGNAAKISRAQAFGHWFWNQPEGSCNSTAVHNLLNRVISETVLRRSFRDYAFTI